MTGTCKQSTAAAQLHPLLYCALVCHMLHALAVACHLQLSVLNAALYYANCNVKSTVECNVVDVVINQQEAAPTAVTNSPMLPYIYCNDSLSLF